MIIATAGYNMDVLPNWQAYADKIESWVATAAGQGADLLVFPEYGAMELATLAGPDVASDLQGCARAVSDRVPEVDALHVELAARYGVHILAASAPVFDPAQPGLPVNRARLITPTGQIGVQDKQIMTRFEREVWGIKGGGPLRLFDTALGRIGVLICYDAEFPLLGHALAQADIVLAPSCTEAQSGYWRVRIGAMARALELQCVTAMASTVGACDWSEAVDTNTGCGGIFGPPDKGFPSTGVLAEGVLNTPGWTFAEVDPDAIAQVRREGAVFNHSDWTLQSGRDTPAPLTPLR